MGTVHGVYLKYVGLSALSYAGLSLLSNDGESAFESVGYAARSLFAGTPSRSAADGSLLRVLPTLALGYSTVLNGFIAVLFKSEWGMGLLGKDPRNGNIPLWSYIIFFPFHIPTKLYTHIHKSHDQHKKKEKRVPVASEVQPGWWVGGCYGHELDMDWAGVIDLTVEFPESTIDRTKAYLSMPTWDGVPATPAQLEEAANFAVHAKGQDGHILVHCAHGRGRSTTVMCACLVKAGLFSNWEEAFEKGIKPQRSVCKLNRRMRQNLSEWQAQYVDGKKGQ